MLSNYLLIAWRNLLKNKVFSLINVSGLAISLSVSVLIFLYVRSELTYDSYHRRSDRIVRITSIFGTPEGSRNMVITGEGIGPLLQAEFPEVEEFVRFSPSVGSVKVSINGMLANEANFLRVDPQVFKVFSFKLIEGDAATCLQYPSSIVLTQATAQKYFGSVPPVGKEIMIDGERRIVTGLIENLPANVDTKVSALLPASTDESNSLMKFAHVTYVLLKEGSDFGVFESKLKDFANRHYDQIQGEQFQVDLSMQRLADIHFVSGYFMDTPKGNKSYPLIFSLAGFLLFCLALFNFINLSAIRLLERAREVGIRKAIGARTEQLIFQFVTETLLLVLITVVLAVTLVQLTLQPFNGLLGSDFSLRDMETLSIVLSVIVILGTIVALTSYLPVTRLSSLPTADVLKGKFQSPHKRFNLRKALILLQFVISGFMVSSTFIIYLQMNFIHDNELGFLKENVLAVDLPEQGSRSAYSFKAEVLSLSGTKASLVGHGAVPGTEASQGSVIITEDGRKDEYWLNHISVDEDFFGVMGITLKDGVSFSELRESEQQNRVLVNESFVYTTGLEDPIGATLDCVVLPGGSGKVGGVVNNYHYGSIHNLIEPLIIDYIDNAKWELAAESDTEMPGRSLLIKMEPSQLPQIEALYYKFYPNEPMQRQFLEESIADMYSSESKLMSLVSYMTFISITIACLGLFGLSGYIIQLKTTEIGIRKVLGASLLSLIRLLSREFIVLVVVAQVIALPFAVLANQTWLQNYAYRIELSWWHFGFSALLLMATAGGTVTIKSMRAARANPVDALRDE